jgi:hypothetical protein
LKKSPCRKKTFSREINLVDVLISLPQLPRKQPPMRTLVSQLGGTLTLVLLSHLGQVVRDLEATQHDLEILDGILASDLECIDRAHVGLGVDLDADDDTVIERVGAL